MRRYLVVPPERKPFLSAKTYKALKKVADVIFAIAIAVLVLVVVALFIWNERSLLDECMKDGYSAQYCARMLGW